MEYQKINTCLQNKEISLAIKETENSGLYFLTLFLGGKPQKMTRIFPMCNWCTTKELINLWNKMNDIPNLILVDSEPCDFYLVVNCPLRETILSPVQKRKTIVLQMEPNMAKEIHVWKEWSNPREEDFFAVFKHAKTFNSLEWHLSKNIRELDTMNIEKTKLFSTVLSKKYTDPGHIKRVDFVRFLERKNVPIDVFGDNRWNYKNYKGSLPYHQKDDAIFPYKYTFNAENHEIKNYFTEKLIDGILGECLTFYSGCPNVKEYIDERAFVQLGLYNFEKDAEIVKKAIEEDWYTQRLPYIKAAKKKILTEMTIFKRILSLINGN